jgi:RHS repeat-associated protein
MGRLDLLTRALAGADQILRFTFNSASQIATRESSNDLYASNTAYDVVRPYSVNGLNQYVEAGPARFLYDANGNLTSDGSTNFVYDAENRLVSAFGAKNATLAYDPLGRLWQVSGPSGTTRFLYDGDDLIQERDGNGNLLRAYVHGPGADEPLMWYEYTAGWSRRFLHADHQGSIVAAADSSGNAIAINAYDSWGIPNRTGIELGRFGYTGQAWLPELGLYHYKSRAYSPTLGRFMQVDSVGYEGGINLYAYVDNDPVNEEDPTGNCPLCIKVVVDFGIEVGIQYATTGSVDLGQAARDIAIGMVNPLRTVERVRDIARIARGANEARQVARGSAGGERAGRPFTQRGRETIDRRNVERHGKPTCEKCGKDVVSGQRHERGVTPPGNERQRDHIIPRSQGGDGSPPNGQVLCRDCNLRKRDQLE